MEANVKKKVENYCVGEGVFWLYCRNRYRNRYFLVITAAQLHSRMPELRFYAGSNPARSVSYICDGEDV